MTLFLATILLGVFLAISGLALLSNHSVVTSVLKGFPRSPTATAVFFGLASLWFLSRIWNLSLADFGEYRHLLFFLFALLAVLSFFYVPDFLAVRGLAGLMLLSAGPLLSSAYMHYELPQRLLLVYVTYALIFAALWLGAQPYRMRDFLEWLFRNASRPRLIGGAALLLGLALSATAFTY